MSLITFLHPIAVGATQQVGNFFEHNSASQARRYAFKCHRKSDVGKDTVYPVNSIAFHPIFGTFASGGASFIRHAYATMACFTALHQTWHVQQLQGHRRMISSLKCVQFWPCVACRWRWRSEHMGWATQEAPVPDTRLWNLHSSTGLLKGWPPYGSSSFLHMGVWGAGASC